MSPVPASRRAAMCGAHCPEPPSGLSKRREVLWYVGILATLHQRPVRAGDVRSAAMRHRRPVAQGAGLTVALTSLVRTGDLKVVGRIFGHARGGSRHFLPTAWDESAFPLPSAETWAERAAAAFRALWAERLQAVVGRGRNPTPIANAELLACLRARHPGTGSKLLADAAYRLRHRAWGGVRRVRCEGSATILLAPHEVPDEALDVTPPRLGGAEKAVEAVRRSVLTANRPIVSAAEIATEIRMDPSLREGTDRGFQSLLGSDCPTLTRRWRMARHRPGARISRVGMVGHRAYYCLGAVSPLAESWLRVLRIRHAWAVLAPEAELEAIDRSELPTLREGRLTRLAGTSRALLATLPGRVSDSDLRTAVAELAATFHDARARIVDFARTNRIRPRSRTRDVVCARIDLATLHRLATTLVPRWNGRTPASLRASVDYSVPTADLIHGRGNASSGPMVRDYDRTEALLWLAQEYGGITASIQAAIVRRELGPLRDPRWVRTALRARDFGHRLLAVACAGFLGGNHLRTAISTLEMNDPMPGVREMAAWALRVSGEEPIEGLRM